MKLTLRLLGLVSAILLALAPVKLAKAQTSDALVDLLVQKGVITDQEGEDIRAKMVKEWATNPASKITLSSAIKNLKFYGDVRMRFESRNGHFAAGDGTAQATGNNFGGATSLSASGNQTVDRFRYRFRLGVTADLYDHWFAGFGVATNPTNQRSGNVTLGNKNDGPFGKGGAAGLSINKVFIGWHATSDITLQVGQFDNPLYTTNLTWDANITPQGFAEMYEHKFGNLTVFANAGQYIYDYSGSNDNGSTASVISGSNLTSTNTFLFDEQIGAKYNINDTTFFKGAVGLMTYSSSKDTANNNDGTIGTGSGLGATVTTAAATNTSTTGQVAGATTGNTGQPYDFSGPFTGGVMGASNTYGINNLSVIDVPMEFDFKAWKTPFKIFGDFAANLDAQGRSNAAANAEAKALAGNPGAISPVTTGNGYTAAQQTAVITNKYMENLQRDNAGNIFNDIAFQAGLQAGELKKKGDWMAKAYWEQTGYYAVDPNLVDADIFDGRTNLGGVVLQGNYNFSDAITATVTYAEASRVDSQLATPGTGNDLTIDPINHYRMIQADLMWKF